MSIRNDPGGDYGEGVGGGGGSPDDWLTRWLSPGDLGDPNDPNSRAAPPTGRGGGGIPGAPGAAGPAAAGAGTAAASGIARYLALAQQLAALSSGIESGRAGSRYAAGQANQNQALAQAQLFRTRMQAALEGPRRSASDAAFGDTMANVQPFRWTGETTQSGNIPIPQSTGGLSPANFGPATRQAGQTLATLGASRVGSPSFSLPEPPTLAPLPQANGFDTALDYGGTISALAAAFLAAYRGGQTPPTVQPPPPAGAG